MVTIVMHKQELIACVQLITCIVLKPSQLAPQVGVLMHDALVKGVSLEISSLQLLLFFVNFQGGKGVQYMRKKYFFTLYIRHSTWFIRRMGLEPIMAAVKNIYLVIWLSLIFVSKEDFAWN